MATTTTSEHEEIYSPPDSGGAFHEMTYHKSTKTIKSITELNQAYARSFNFKDSFRDWDEIHQHENYDTIGDLVIANRQKHFKSNPYFDPLLDEKSSPMNSSQNHSLLHKIIRFLTCQGA